MWKAQRLHDYLLQSQLVKADSLSVYSDEGKVDWMASPDRQAFGLTYVANILVREYASKPHWLFLCLVSALAEIDPNPDKPHDPTWGTSVLDKATVDVEFKITFVEWYEYRDAEPDETAEWSVDGVPVVLVEDDIPPLGDFIRFALIMNNDHHL